MRLLNVVLNIRERSVAERDEVGVLLDAGLERAQQHGVLLVDAHPYGEQSRFSGVTGQIRRLNLGQERGPQGGIAQLGKGMRLDRHRRWGCGRSRRRTIHLDRQVVHHQIEILHQCLKRLQEVEAIADRIEHRLLRGRLLQALRDGEGAQVKLRSDERRLAGDVGRSCDHILAGIDRSAQVRSRLEPSSR